jgi:Meckel syndrome type 1 protein
MTQMRDPRLQRALGAAPDADAVPSDATRRTIREAARDALLRKAARAPWWRRWLGEPRERMPWNAAFATVLVAVLVGLLWHEQEVPGVRPESEPTKGAKEAGKEAPKEVAKETPKEAAQPAAAADAAPPIRRENPPPPPKPAPPQKAARQAGNAPRTQAPPQPAAAPAPAPERESRRAERAEPLAQRAPNAPMPGAAPPAELRDNKATRDSAAADSKPSMAAGARAARSEAFAAPRAWTAMRVHSDERTRTLARDEAPRLSQSVQAAVNAAMTADAFEPQGTVLRIELLREDRAITVVEIAGDRVRVSDTAQGASPRTGRIDAQQADALRDEARRLLLNAR